MNLEKRPVSYIIYTNIIFQLIEFLTDILTKQTWKTLIILN